MASLLPVTLSYRLGACGQRTPRKGSWPVTLLFSIALAGLMGACGVILAAGAAHGGATATLTSAAYMLLLHAAAVLAGAALLERDVLWRWPLVLGLFAWIVGASLFSGDIAMRTFVGQRLFAMAAPTGGTIMIAGWILVAIAACGAIGRR